MHVFCIFVVVPVQRKGACLKFHMERRSRNTLIIIIIILAGTAHQTDRKWVAGVYRMCSLVALSKIRI